MNTTPKTTPPTLGERLAGLLTPKELRVETLSPRQVEILERIANGQGDKQIAAELHCSTHTIKSQLLRVFEKLGTRTRAAAVYHYAVNGLGDARKGD